MNDSAISLKGIGKKYRTYSSRSLRLKKILGFDRKEERRSRDFWALSDIDLEVAPGATLGILGRNGAGKSTLLSIISGVSRPSTGTVEVNGRLAAIFSTGAGFNPEFTGRENVMLNGLILGIDYEDLLARFDDIAAFADIGEFMEQPIKTYSSGMRSRLGFAVAVNVEPDVLLIDEALSAGDAAFKKKALQRMYDLRDSGTTVLFVSHSLGMVQTFCTDAVLLHKGRMVSSGSPEEVVTEYRDLLEKAQDQEAEASTSRGSLLDEAIGHEDEEDMGERPPGDGAPRGIEVRGGTVGVRVVSVELLDEARRPVDTVISGSRLTVRVHVEYSRAAPDSALSITLRDAVTGFEVFSTGTEDEGASLGSREAGERVAVDFTFDVPLRPGEFEVDASASASPEGEPGRVAGAATLRIGSPHDERPVRGLIYLPATVEVLDPPA